MKVPSMGQNSARWTLFVSFLFVGTSIGWVLWTNAAHSVWHEAVFLPILTHSIDSAQLVW